MKKNIVLENVKYKGTKGITLIALVITIIILLILAGVSINLLFNGEGLFIKANDVASKYNQLKEDESNFLQEAEEKYNDVYEESKPTGTPSGEDCTTKHIKTPEGLKEVDAKDIYGATVTGYKCDRDINWQIFYIDCEDDHRVYLISKSGVTPPTTRTELKKSELANTYYWDGTSLNGYKGYIPTSTTTTILGKFIGKFLNEFAGNNASSQENLQATNYMLNQTTWKEYIGDKADLAFGGPTLPLFKASYNDICEKENRLDIKKYEKGYQIRKGGGDWDNGQKDLGDTNTQKGIYFYRNDTSSAYGVWCASPSSSNTNTMITTYYDGQILSKICSSYYTAFRPIVALKSSVTFKENADGSYSIN